MASSISASCLFPSSSQPQSLCPVEKNHGLSGIVPPDVLLSLLPKVCPYNSTQCIPQATDPTPALESVCSLYPHGPSYRQHRDGSTAQLLYVSFSVSPDSCCKNLESSIGDRFLSVLCEKQRLLIVQSLTYSSCFARPNFMSCPVLLRICRAPNTYTGKSRHTPT